MILDVKALVFDVFGTVVDWRQGIIREIEAALPGINASAFADAWRGAYQPSMSRVRTGELAWTNLDALHLMSLERLLAEFGVALDATARDRLNRAWHRLPPWPDAVAGLWRLKRRYTIGTLSNGNVALLSNMAKRAGLPWDVILSAEIFRHYKPDPETYRGAAALLGLAPGEVMLVAAHNGDLLGAQREGLRTGFVARPSEYGPGQTRDQRAEHDFDVVARDFEHLAELLGA